MITKSINYVMVYNNLEKCIRLNENELLIYSLQD